MSEPAGEWRFYRFGLMVTGKSERAFLPTLFRSLTVGGHCMFEVIRKIEQLRPLQSAKKKAAVIVAGKRMLNRREEQIGIPARKYLDGGPDRFVVLVDDIEHDHRPQMQAVFDRYRESLDTILKDRSGRAAVHFFANMVEAYYFADAAAVNAALGTGLKDQAGDVEDIRHPKNDLKGLVPGFDEKEHGRAIVAKLDLEKVLSRPDTCASLRSLFKWCCKAMGEAPTERFRLIDGRCNPITDDQASRLP